MERTNVYCELHKEYSCLDGMYSWVPLERLKEFLLKYYKDTKPIEVLETSEELLEFISQHQVQFFVTRIRQENL